MGRPGSRHWHPRPRRRPRRWRARLVARGPEWSRQPRLCAHRPARRRCVRCQSPTASLHPQRILPTAGRWSARVRQLKLAPQPAGASIQPGHAELAANPERVAGDCCRPTPTHTAAPPVAGSVGTRPTPNASTRRSLRGSSATTLSGAATTSVGWLPVRVSTTAAVAATTSAATIASGGRRRARRMTHGNLTRREPVRGGRALLVNVEVHAQQNERPEHRCEQGGDDLLDVVKV